MPRGACSTSGEHHETDTDCRGDALPPAERCSLAQPALSIHRESSSTVTLSFAEPGMRTVDLGTISGSIRLTSEDRRDVRLTVTRRTDAGRESDLPDADRRVRLETSTQAGTISAIVHDRDQVCGQSNNGQHDAWWDRPRYRVKVDLMAVVPHGSRIRLCTVNGDAIVATGTFGEFDVSNVNGRVEVSGVRGSGRAVTANGPVAVTFAEAPRDASEFRSVNGNVVVTFPGDLAAGLRLKTFNGQLLTDFDMEPVPVEIAAGEGQKGRFVYRSKGMTTVRVGRGGPQLTFETLNGDVRILRAADEESHESASPVISDSCHAGRGADCRRHRYGPADRSDHRAFHGSGASRPGHGQLAERHDHRPRRQSP